MLKKPWELRLRQILSRAADGGEMPRVAVLGIGNEMLADDGAGMLAARCLQGVVTGDKRLLVIPAGVAPENCTARLRRFEPDVVLLIDAADVGDEPGHVRLLPWAQAGVLGASTHSLPLRLVGDYLANELGCQLALIGIQPENIGLDLPVSNRVGAAVRDLAFGLARMLAEPGMESGGMKCKATDATDLAACEVALGHERVAR
jgi:hydrogenase 3 maturation protease